MTNVMGAWQTRKLPSASIVAVTPHCRCQTSVYLFLSHISISKRLIFFFFLLVLSFFPSFPCLRASCLFVFVYDKWISCLVFFFFCFDRGLVVLLICNTIKFGDVLIFFWGFRHEAQVSSWNLHLAPLQVTTCLGGGKMNGKNDFLIVYFFVWDF